MDAVEDKSPALALQIDDALDPQQVPTLRLNELVEPAREQCRIDRTLLANGNAGNIRVVLVRAVGQQFGIELQRISEIEGAHADYMTKIDIATSRLMHLRERIKRPK